MAIRVRPPRVRRRLGRLRGARGELHRAPSWEPGEARHGAPPAPGAGVRPEIQALRAVAVLLVAVHHLWPDALSGGFVGVDVFFAISGYLITSLLVRELDRTGRLSLSGFWAPRPRRILPAALTTLMFCAVATVLVA